MSTGRGAVVAALLVASVAAAQDIDAGALPAGLVPPELKQDSPLLLPVDVLPREPSTVELQLTIDEQGVVTAVEVVLSPNADIATFAEEAARKLVFSPATVDGKPVPVVLPFRYVLTPAPIADAGDAPGSLLVGRVMTKGTRDPIAAATVSAADAGMVETDGDGRFSLPLPPGVHQVLVQAPGHRAEQFEETIAADQRLEVVYRIVPTSLPAYQTTIEGQRDRAEVARAHLSGPELREVPGTRGEPLRVVMLLPGVTSLASGLSYPIVRGFTPAATGFFLDGIRIPQLYHLGVGPSVIHPGFIDSIDFFPGNAPVRFGRLTGGAISVNPTKPADDRVHVDATIDALQAGAFVDTPIDATGTKVSLAGRVSYTGWLLGLLAKAEGAHVVADYWDYQARIEQPLGKGNIRLLAFGSSDLVGERDTEGAVFVESVFHRYDVKGTYPLGPGTIEAGINAGWDRMGTWHDDANGKQDGVFRMKRWLVSGRALYRVDLSPELQLKAGVDLERQDSGVELTNTIGPDASVFLAPRAIGIFSGVFGELAWFHGPLSLIGGVRLDNYLVAHGRDSVAFDPRLIGRYALNENLTLRAGAGLFHQAPTVLLALPVTDVAGLSDGLQEAWQFDVGADWKLPWWGLELSATAYYDPITRSVEKSLRQLVSGENTLDDQQVARKGRSYGFELMLRLPPQGRFFGWITYSLMRSERERTWIDFDTMGNPGQVQTAMLPFAFDETHNVNLVAGVQLPWAIKASITFHFNTGRPENGEVSSRTADLISGADGHDTWLLRPLGKVDRLPPFVRLDARVSKTFRMDQVTLELFLDVLNASASNEVYGYQYGFDPNSGVPQKKPIQAPIILPTIGLRGVY